MKHVDRPSRKRMKRVAMMTGATALLCLVALSMFVQGDARSAEATLAPRRLQMAVGCLFATEWMRNYSFTSFGYKKSDWILVRYHVGTIPGDGPTPGAFNVMVYSRDGRYGFLLEAAPNNRGGFFASQNDYSLRKTHGRWHVIEGEGGYRDYEVVERWVNSISGQPYYRVQLLPGGKECSSD